MNHTNTESAHGNDREALLFLISLIKVYGTADDPRDGAGPRRPPSD